MSNVVQFPLPHTQEKTVSGDAFCLECRHVWVATAPLETDYLECPSCSRYKGVFKFPYVPDYCWECNCGNQIFYITRDGYLCPRCGNYTAPIEVHDE